MTTNTEILGFAKKALHLVRINIPYLAELTHNIEICESNRIDTAGIFASGRLIYNAEWLGKLSLEDATFVIAHEIMHLALRSHYRSDDNEKELFNITHDFIINEMLKETFDISEVPAHGLDWEKAYGSNYDIKDKSAEELMKFIKDAFENGQLDNKILKKHWNVPKDDDNIFEGTGINLPFADKLSVLLPNHSENQKKVKIDETEKNSILNSEEKPDNKERDVLSDDFEKELFPETTDSKISEKKNIIYQQISNALSIKLINEKQKKIYGIGTEAGNLSDTYDAIRTFHKPPWEVALQSWLEFTARTGRTYASPSRRGQYKGFVRPGYKREGHTLHIVVDTSGSMFGVLGKILATIASFCEALLIQQVHIIQCDTEVSDDSWYSPDELLFFEIKGLGGSDMSPGMQRLAEDNEVEFVLVITDGYIEYPRTPMPYEVLWVLTELDYFFEPSYGEIIMFDDE